MIICIKQESVVLDGATPSGGVYSGVGVEGSVFYPALAGLGVHEITYTYTEPGTLCVKSCTFEITVRDCQTIPLAQGWGSISSYLEPMAVNKGLPVEDVLESIWDQIVVVQHFNQIIYPAYQIHNMGDFTTDHGYIIKTTEPVELSISGMPADLSIPLNKGWNVMPVMQECNVSAADVFGEIPELVIAVEIGGNGIFYPAGDIYTLEELMPGKSYYVKVTDATEYTFPGCDSKDALSYVSALRPTSSAPWNEVNYTGLSHTVIFTATAVDRLKAGDIIGAFAANDVCSGIVEVNDVSTGFALFGNDITSGETDGFESGEILTFRVYRPETGESFTLDLNYDVHHNQGFFEPHGLSLVNDLKVSSTGLSEYHSAGLGIYPNPSKGVFIIDGLNELVKVNVINAFGAEVFYQQMTLPGTIDLSSQPKGVYFVQLHTTHGVEVQKLIVK